MVWVTEVNDCKHRYVEQAKDADKLEPKGKWLDVGMKAPNTQTKQPPVYRSALTQYGYNGVCNFLTAYILSNLIHRVRS